MMGAASGLPDGDAVVNFHEKINTEIQFLIVELITNGAGAIMLITAAGLRYFYFIMFRPVWS